MKLRTATCALVITMGSLAGCGSGETGTGLTDMLGQIKNTESARGYLNYGSLEILKQKTGLDDRVLAEPRFRRVYRFATGTLAAAGVGKLEKDLGADLRKSKSAILVGEPPNQVGVFYGTWDAEAIGGKFAKLKRTSHDESGGTMWVFSEQPTLGNDKDPLFKSYFNNFNMAYVSADKLAYSPSRQGISQAIGVDGETLADAEQHKIIADCLGDVTAALVITPRNPQLIGMAGVGVRVESKDKTTEVVCLIPSPGGNPKKMADAVQSQVGEGEFSSYLKLPKVAIDNETKLIELSGPSAKEVGLVFDMVTTGSLDRLVDATGHHGEGHHN